MSGAGSEVCTQLEGLPNFPLDDPTVPSNGTFAKASKTQLVVIGLLISIALNSDITTGRKYKAETDAKMDQGLMGALPDDQWAQELYSWEAISWQHTRSFSPTSPSDLAYEIQHWS